MKLHIDLPWGGCLDIERQPMQMEKFYALCGVAGGALVVLLFVGLSTYTEIVRGREYFILCLAHRIDHSKREAFSWKSIMN